MERVTAMEKFFERYVLLYSTPPRKVAVEEAVCEREPGNIPIDMLCMAVKKELS